MDNLPIIISLVSLAVAVFSFFLSFFNSFRLRKKIDFMVCKRADRIKGILVYQNSDKPKKLNVPYSHVISIAFVNPSSAPISFFDLEVTSLDRKKVYNYLIKALGDCIFARAFAYVIDQEYLLDIPQDVSGSLAPNSCRYYHLAINAPADVEVFVSFKIPKKTFFKRRNHSQPERYKTISRRVMLP